MRWLLTTGRFGGAAVKIRVTFALLLAWIGFSGWLLAGPLAALDSVVFIALLFACVVLHEFGHVLTARRYGAVDAEFPVIDAFGKPIGLLMREDILDALKKRDRDAAIADFMRAPPETIRASAPLEEAVDRFARRDLSGLCVVDGDGVLVGLLTRRNLAELMMIRSLRPDWRFERRRGAPTPRTKER